MESRTIIGALLVLTVVCPTLISSQSKGELFPPPNDRGVISTAAGYIKDQLQSRVNPSPQSYRPEYYQSPTQAPYSKPYPQNYYQLQQTQYQSPPVQQNDYNNQQYSYQSQAQPGYQTQTQHQAQPAYHSQAQPAYQSQAQPAYQSQAQPAYQGQPAYQSTSRPYQTNRPGQTNYRPPAYVPTNQYSHDSDPRPQQSPQYQPNFITPTQSSSRFGETGQDQLVDPDFPTRRPTRIKTATKTTRKPPSFTSGSRFSDRDDIKKLLKWDASISNSMEAFALKLMVTLNENDWPETFMVSPFSIYHMLVLIAEGAKANTFVQLNNTLGLQSMAKTRDFQQYLGMALNQSSADITLRKFAMIITDSARPASNDYESRIEKTYDASVEKVEFAKIDQTLNYINSEVSKLTNNEIRDAITKEDLLKAQLILLSGLFFQGSWAHVFNTSFTKVEAFHDTNGNRIGEVNMMFQRGPFAYSAVAELGCHIIELPYADIAYSNRNDDVPAGTGLSMILALPKKGLEIADAMHNIYQHGMSKINKELYDAANEYGDEEVEVHIPRFEISTNMNLRTPLENMDITDLFDQTRANLSNINDQYFVSAMIHKTKISVDERGTTAAAVTTSVFANKATPPKFHANKPFIFFIVDRVTKLILFSGQYATPTLY